MTEEILFSSLPTLRSSRHGWESSEEQTGFGFSFINTSCSYFFILKN